MKKIIALVLIMAMALSLVACASSNENNAVNNDAANNSANNAPANDGAANENMPTDNSTPAVDGDNEADVPATMPEDGEVEDMPAVDGDVAVDGPAAMPEDDVVEDVPAEDVPEEGAPAAPSGDSMGKVLMNYFTSLVNGGETNLETLANSIVTHESIQFMGGAMQVAPGYLAGFNSDVTGFSDGWFFGPMIGTIPFAGYVFTVDGDANAFADSLKADANLRWNICTSADEINVKVIGNIIFCLLSPYAIEG